MPTPDAPAPPPGEVRQQERPRGEVIKDLWQIRQLALRMKGRYGSWPEVADYEDNWNSIAEIAREARELLLNPGVAPLPTERGLTVARDAPDVGMIPASSYDDAVRVVGQLELNVRYWRARAERA